MMKWSGRWENVLVMVAPGCVQERQGHLLGPVVIQAADELGQGSLVLQGQGWMDEGVREELLDLCGLLLMLGGRSLLMAPGMILFQEGSQQAKMERKKGWKICFCLVIDTQTGICLPWQEVGVSADAVRVGGPEERQVVEELGDGHIT